MLKKKEGFMPPKDEGRVEREKRPEINCWRIPNKNGEDNLGYYAIAEGNSVFVIGIVNGNSFAKFLTVRNAEKKILVDDAGKEYKLGFLDYGRGVCNECGNISDLGPEVTSTCGHCGVGGVDRVYDKYEVPVK